MDGSGEPSVVVVRKGSLKMEEDVYSEVLDGPQEELASLFLNWGDD